MTLTTNGTSAATPVVKHVTAADFPKLLDQIETFIFDCDGVLWLGENVIAGSADFIRYILDQGKQAIILTNNATESRESYANKLATLGYDARLTKKDIVNPAAVAADYLEHEGIKQSGKRVYLIGSKGMKDELDALNIDYFGEGLDPVDRQPDTRPFIYDLVLDVQREQVGAVYVGYEKYFNYLKLMKAANYLKDDKCLFVATNEDATLPGPDPKMVIPDAGPLIAAVTVAAGREPVIVGKPHTPVFEYISRHWTVNREKTLMIGDRTNTDIKFGRDHGLKTMLVLSGCHQVADIEDNIKKGINDSVPDYYAQCLGAIIPPH